MSMDGVDIIPERQAKPPEIGPDRACLRVAAAEWLLPEKLGSHQSLQVYWIGDRMSVDAQLARVAAEPV